MTALYLSDQRPVVIIESSSQVAQTMYDCGKMGGNIKIAYKNMNLYQSPLFLRFFFFWSKACGISTVFEELGSLRQNIFTPQKYVNAQY